MKKYAYIALGMLVGVVIATSLSLQAAPTTILHYMAQIVDETNDRLKVSFENAISGFTVSGGDLDVSGGDIILQNDETIGNATDGLVDVAGKFEVVETSAYTDTAVTVANIELQSSGTPANGFSAVQTFSVETTDSNVETIASIEGYVADVTSTSEDGEIIFKTMTAGAAATEKLRIHDTGEVEFQKGILPDAVTADPCGSGYPEGSIFYNTTGNFLCYCNGTDDVKASDDTTACF